jgi:hypothetical protein
MMLFTLGGSLILTLIKNLKDFIAIRTLRLGTSFEAEPCLVTDLTDLDTVGLLSSATMILTPNNSSETEIVQVLPLPSSDIRNLIFRSEGTTTSWTVLQTTQAVFASLNPTGGSTVIKMTETATTNNHYRNQTLANNIQHAGEPYVWSCYLKQGDGVGSPDIMQLAFSVSGYANFNIVTGAVTLTSGVTASITDEGNGWWRCAILGNSPTTSGTSNVFVSFVNNNPTAARLPSYPGAINRNTLMFGAQFELGTSLTPYQKIEIAPQTTNNYTYFGNTSTPYRTTSTGELSYQPYENLIYPSIQITTLTGQNWRWLIAGFNTTVSGILAPDGTLTASKFNLGGSINSYYMSYQTSGTSVAAPSFPTSRIRTLIFYTKQIGISRYLGIKLGVGSNVNAYGDNTVTIKIDTLNATLINSPTAYNITYASQASTNGWYKVCINCDTAWDSLSLTISASTASMTNSLDGPGLWGVQIVNGTVDINTPIYNREIGYNIPRLDYSGSSCPEYLLESVNYNTLLQSEDFTAANWIKTNVTVASNTEMAPNGELVADTLTATSSLALIRQSGQANNSIAFNRMFSVYLKRKTGTGDVIVDMGPVSEITSLSVGSWTRAFVLAPTLAGTYTATAGAYTITTTLPHGFSTGDAIRFDATTGAGVDASIGSITVTGLNQFTFSNGSATSSGNCGIYSNTGKIRIQTNGDEVYAWGAQIESSLANVYSTSPVNIPSSYIPTTTAQVTKQSDATISNFNGSSNCSLFFEMSKNGGSNNTATPYVLIGNETGMSLCTDALELVGTLNNTTSLYKKENNGAIVAIQAPILPISNFPNADYSKTLITIEGTTLRVWIDGSQVAVSTFANPSLLKYLTLQQNSSVTLRLKQLSGWDSTLDSNESYYLTAFSYPTFNAGYTPVNVELQEIINRGSYEGFTIPTPTQLGHCDTLITDLKNDGVWVLSDVYFNFTYNDLTLEQFARINWKNPYGRLGMCNFLNSLVYQTTGIKGNPATNAYVDTNYNPNASGNNYTLNNAGRITIISEALDVNAPLEGNFTFHNDMRQGNWNTNSINSQNNSAVILPYSGIGLKSIMRDDATNIRGINRDIVTTTTQVSMAIQNNIQTIHAAQFGYGNSCCSFYWMGASLSNTQIQNLRAYHNTYLVSIGLTAYA